MGTQLSQPVTPASLLKATASVSDLQRRTLRQQLGVGADVNTWSVLDDSGLAALSVTIDGETVTPTVGDLAFYPDGSYKRLSAMPFATVGNWVAVDGPQVDWNASSGPGLIRNKPTLPTSDQIAHGDSAYAATFGTAAPSASGNFAPDWTARTQAVTVGGDVAITTSPTPPTSVAFLLKNAGAQRTLAVPGTWKGVASPTLTIPAAGALLLTVHAFSADDVYYATATP